MRRLPIVLALLFLLVASHAQAVGPITWYVRTDGNDTTCNGTVNAGSGSEPNCAFLTYNHAKETTVTGQRPEGFSCADSDRIVFGVGSFQGPFSLPFPCRAPDEANPFVLEGQGASTVLLGSPGAAYTITSSNNLTNFGSHDRHIIIRNMKIMNSNQGVIGLTGMFEDVWIDNNDITHDGSGLFGGAGYAILWLTGNNNHWRPRITNNRVIGLGTRTFSTTNVVGSYVMFAQIQTAPTCATCTGNHRAVISDNTVTNILGAFVDGNITDGIVERNIVDGSWCDPTDENACIQIYNARNVTVRYNRFTRITPNRNQGFSLVRMRTSKHSFSDVANIFLYNNTISGQIGTPWDSARSRTVLAIIASELGAPGSPCDDSGGGSGTGASCFDPDSPRSYVTNNLILEDWGLDVSPFGNLNGSEDTAIIITTKCGTAGLEVSHNLAWRTGQRPTGGTPSANVRWKFGTCAATDTGNLWGIDPGVNATTLAPDSASDAVCGAGDTSFVAPDGDRSKNFIGYTEGACAGGPVLQTYTVTKAGTGAGTVSSSDSPGFFCGPGCTNSSANFTEGQVVTVTATADASSVFVGFTGTGCGTTSPATVTMSVARNCTATFTNHCSSGILDGDETCVDGGGSCAATCADGQACNDNSDCGSNSACVGGPPGVCTPVPTCADGIKNQGESDIDCSGPCEKCAAGEECVTVADCRPLLECTGGPPTLCQVPVAPPESIKIVGTVVLTGGVTIK